MAKAASGDTRKLIAFDEETWNALDLFARESMRSLQELSDEAFGDLLEKHGRPTDLKSALRRSAAGPAEARGTRKSAAGKTAAARPKAAGKARPRKKTGKTR